MNGITIWITRLILAVLAGSPYAGSKSGNNAIRPIRKNQRAGKQACRKLGRFWQLLAERGDSLVEHVFPGVGGSQPLLILRVISEIFASFNSVASL
jgi:hypothetical protein